MSGIDKHFQLLAEQVLILAVFVYWVASQSSITPISYCYLFISCEIESFQRVCTQARTVILETQKMLRDYNLWSAKWRNYYLISLYRIQEVTSKNSKKFPFSNLTFLFLIL